MEFSVPYNGDRALLPQLFELKEHNGNRIREIFLSGPREYGSSGRVAHNGDHEQFAETVQEIHDAGIRVNIVMNSTCQGVEWYSDGRTSYLRDFVTYLVEYLGVEAFTMANPYMMAIVHEVVPSAELSASVLGDVDCVERARAFVRAGASVVTPDVAINRDLAMLKRIHEQAGLELKVMVNEGCLHKCPYRKYHFNAISHISENAAFLGHGLSMEEFKAQCNVVAGKTFFGMCGVEIAEDHSQILKSGWIRPEDQRRYADIASFFKISGRTVATKAVLRMVRAYMEESYEGDLMDIMDSSLRVQSLLNGLSVNNQALGEERFFDHVIGCNRDCGACGYCSDLADKLVVFGVESSIKETDKDFFGK